MRVRSTRLRVAILMTLLLCLALTPVAAEEARPTEGASLLDGALLPIEEATRVNSRLPVAVVVDNLATGARPQYGLDRADLVYELLVEAGITRFLAVYLRRDAPWVEPVRSVRTPFLYLVSELDAVLVHVGAAETPGPADAGSQMREWGIRHLDEPTDPALFRRDPRRRAPHNALTNVAAVRAEAEARGWAGPPRLEPWPFKDDFAVTNAGAEVVASRITYGWTSRPLRDFVVEWQYEPATNTYRRQSGGRPHTDALTREPLRARNVVVQFVRTEVVNREGHLLYDLIGEGMAYAFMDGRILPVVWTKPAREARTRYFDADGAELHFNRGATWVALLSLDSPMRWE